MHRAVHPVLALVTATLVLAGCGEDPAADSTRSAGTSASPSPTPASPSPTGDPSLPFTPLPTDGGEVLPAGRYALTVAKDVDPDLPWAVVDVPPGFGHYQNWILSDEEPEGDDGVALSYWTLHSVYHDPCASDVVVTETVKEAAAAFRAQARSEVTAPRPVSLGGHQGLYLEVRVPETTDFTACPEYHAWDIDEEGGLPYLQSPGRLRLWLLDIGGDVVVVDADDNKDVSRSDRRQLEEMVESLRFVPRT